MVKKRSLILINPPLQLPERYGQLWRAGNRLPNLGLCYLAAMAKKIGWKVKIIDAPALGLTSSKIVEIIKEENPGAVGLTASTPGIYKAAEVAGGIKQVCPEVFVLIGGPHLTALPIRTLQDFEAFDIGVIGEGEHTLVELLNHLESRAEISQIAGIVYRKEGKVFFTSPRPYISDLDELPFPAWELLPALDRFYRPSLQCLRRLPATILVTSRGCPYRCIFCDQSVFGNRVRAHSANYVVDMVKYLKQKYAIREFAFQDECLLSFKERAIEISEQFLRKNLKISWTIQARVDQVESKVLRLFKKAGCWQIQIGIESGDEKVLRILQKGIRKEQIQDVCRKVKEAGISLKGFFILGNPGETLNSMKETLRFALSLPLDDFQLTYFTPYPGSPIYSEIEKWGRGLRDDFVQMSEYNITFVPHSLTQEQLQSQFREMYKRFYFRPRIIFNYILKMQQPSLWRIYLEALVGFMKFVYYKESQ